MFRNSTLPSPAVAGVLLLCLLAHLPALPCHAEPGGTYQDLFGNTLELVVSDAGVVVSISGQAGEFQGTGLLVSERVYELSDTTGPVMLLFSGGDDLLLTPLKSAFMEAYGPFCGSYYRPGVVADFIPPIFAYLNEQGFLILEYEDQGMVTVTLRTDICEFTTGGGLTGNHGVQLYENYEMAMTIYYAPEFAMVHSLNGSLCPQLENPVFQLDSEATNLLRQARAQASMEGVYRSPTGTVTISEQGPEHATMQLRTPGCSTEGLLTMRNAHMADLVPYGSSQSLASFIMGDGYLLVAPLSDIFCPAFEDFIEPFVKDGSQPGQFQEPGGDFSNGEVQASIFYSGEQLAQISISGPECSFVGDGVVFLNHGIQISGPQGEVQAMMWYEGDELAIQRMASGFCPQCTACDGLYSRVR